MAKPIRIGDLRHVVQILMITETPNVDGGLDVVATTVATVHANVETVGAITFWSSGSQELNAAYQFTHRVTIRWMPYLTVSHRIARSMLLPDGATRIETYKVLRTMEPYDYAPHTWLVVECNLESVSDTPAS